MDKLFHCVILVVALYTFQVLGNGQVLLDRIKPVNDERVTFLDNALTNDGVVQAIDTQTFELTRQHEILVGVRDVFLTGLEGGAGISTTLGTTITSLYDDVTFEAFQNGTNQQVTVSGSNVHFEGVDNVVIESQSTGSVLIDSTFPIELRSSGANVLANEKLTLSTSGNVHFTAGSDLILTSAETITFDETGVIDFEANTGNLFFTTGGSFLISASNDVRIDGSRGMSLESQGDVTIVGGETINLMGLETDAVSRQDISVLFSTVDVYGHDGVAVGGRVVEIVSRGDLDVGGVAPNAEILVNYGVQATLTAQNSIFYSTDGEGSPVRFDHTSFSASTGDDFYLFANRNIYLGSNQTNTASVLAREVQLNSYNQVFRSGEKFSVDVQFDTVFSSRNIYSVSHFYEEEATVGPIFFNANALDVSSALGDPLHQVRILSDGDITNTAQNNLQISSQTLWGEFETTQTYTVKNAIMETSFNRDVVFHSEGLTQWLVRNNVDLSSSITKLLSNVSQTWNIGSYTLNANSLTSTSDLQTFITTRDVNLNSGNEVTFEGNDLGVFSGGRFDLSASNTLTLNVGENLVFSANVDVDVNVNDHALFTVEDQSLLSAVVQKITNSDEFYAKTTDYIASGGQHIYNAGDFYGGFGELLFSGAKDFNLNTDGRGDINLASGSQLALIAGLNVEINVGSTLDSVSQEELRIHADTTDLNITSSSFTVRGSDNINWAAREDMSWSASFLTIDSKILEAFASDYFSLTALNTANFFSDRNVIEAYEDISLSNARGSLNFNTQSKTSLGEINSFAHVFQISSISTTTVFANDQVTHRADDFSLVSFSTLDVDTPESNLWGSGVMFTSSSLSEFHANEIYSWTGFDLSMKGTSLGPMVFSSDQTHITSSSTVDFEAVLDVLIIDSYVKLQSYLGETTISAGDYLQVTSSLIDIDSFDNLSFEAASMRFEAVDHTFNFGQDFSILSSKTPFDACAVSFTNLFSAEFQSQNGELFLGAQQNFTVNAFDSGILVQSAGNTFIESARSALYFEAFDSLIVETQMEDFFGNIELQSNAADLWALGTLGFNLFSGEHTNFLAQDGMNITAQSVDNLPVTISISSSSTSTIDGARGVVFVAGLDAPIASSDFSASGAYLNLETYDLLHVRAASDFLVNTAGVITITAHEASLLSISSSRDFESEIDRNINFFSEDSDISFFANAFGLYGEANDNLLFSTNDGPIELHAIAGDFSLEAQNWQFKSEMDTRLLTLGFAYINAGSSVRLDSFAENCVLLQNHRSLDNIYLNARNDITYSSLSTSQLLHDTHLNVLGNNIDISVLEGSVEFNSELQILVGNETSPYTRFTADTIDFSQLENLLITTLNTLTGISPSITFSAGNYFNLKSTGLIELIAQRQDANYQFDDSITMSAEYVNINAVGQHTINTLATSFESYGDEIGDRLEFRATELVTLDSSVNIEMSSRRFLLNTNDIFLESVTNLEFSSLLQTTPTSAFTERSDILVTADGDFTLTNENTLIELSSPPYFFYLDGGVTFDVNSFTFTGTTLSFESDYLAVETSQLSLTFNDGLSIVASDPNAAPHYANMNTNDMVGFNSIDTFTISNTNDFIILTEQNFNVYSDETTVVSIIGAYNILQDPSQNPPDTEPGNIALVAKSSQLEFFGTSLVINVMESFTLNSDVDVNFNVDSYTLDTMNTNIETGTAYLFGENGIFLDGTSTTTPFQLLTDGVGSDITLTGTDLVLSSTDISFKTSTGIISIDTQTLVLNGFTTTKFQTDSGDITFSSGVSLTQLIATDLLVSAEGYNEDHYRGITIQGSTEISLTAISDFTATSKIAHEFNSITQIDFSGPSMRFFSSNDESPIEFISKEDISIQSNSIALDSSVNALSATINFNVLNSFDMGLSLSPAVNRDTGISFNTNPEKYAVTVINLNAFDEFDASSNYLMIQTDHSVSDNGNILLNSLNSEINTQRASFIAEWSNMIFMGASFALDAPIVDIRAASNEFNFDTSIQFTSPFLQIESYNGEVDIQISTLSAPEIILDTAHFYDADVDGFGRRNDILFASEDFTVSADTMYFQCAGSNCDIDISTDFITFTSVASTSFYSASGISWISRDGMLFDFTGDVRVTSSEWKANIFFDGDFDVIFDASIASGKIRHSNYHERLGFFSVRPMPIHLVNLMTYELCARPQVGGCGPSGQSSISYTFGLFSLSNAATATQYLLMNFGLIEWNTNVV